MLTTALALLTLVSVATGAIPDCSYTQTPCSCTGSCTSSNCGITVAEGGSSWTASLHFTFDGSRKYCDFSFRGRYSYSGSEVTQIPVGTPTVSGDSSCTFTLGPQVTFDYTVEENGVVSMISKTSSTTGRLFPDACPLSVGAGIAIGVSVLVSVLVLGVAILGFVRWRRKRARMPERGGQLISAPTYDMGLNEAFISAAQPSSQPPVVAVQMPAMTPEAAPQAPIINTIPTTTPVFGADGKPIINTIPTTTSVFGADGKPASHNVVLDLD